MRIRSSWIPLTKPTGLTNKISRRDCDWRELPQFELREEIDS